MDIASKHVYDVLEARGVTTLFHANSVLTATHFLEARALLARGVVERRGLQQSAQASDEADKRHSVWFDVFTDSVDIHHRTAGPNFYGPVTFCLDVATLRSVSAGRIWVTRSNPIDWKGKDRDGRWFSSAAELREGFAAGTFRYMIVYRHCGGELPVSRALKELILDDPGLASGGVSYFDAAHGALRAAAGRNGLPISIRRRPCATHCRCRAWYSANRSRAKELFFPHVPLQGG